MSAPRGETEAREAHLSSIPPRFPPEPGRAPCPWASWTPWLHWRDPWVPRPMARLRLSDVSEAAQPLTVPGRPTPSSRVRLQSDWGFSLSGGSRWCFGCHEGFSEWVPCEVEACGQALSLPGGCLGQWPRTLLFAADQGPPERAAAVMSDIPVVGPVPQLPVSQTHPCVSHPLCGLLLAEITWLKGEGAGYWDVVLSPRGAPDFHKRETS